MPLYGDRLYLCVEKEYGPAIVVDILSKFGEHFRAGGGIVKLKIAGPGGCGVRADSIVVFFRGPRERYKSLARELISYIARQQQTTEALYLYLLQISADNSQSRNLKQNHCRYKYLRSLG